MIFVTLLSHLSVTRMLGIFFFFAFFNKLGVLSPLCSNFLSKIWLKNMLGITKHNYFKWQLIILEPKSLLIRHGYIEGLWLKMFSNVIKTLFSYRPRLLFFFLLLLTNKLIICFLWLEENLIYVLRKKSSWNFLYFGNF